MASDIQLPSNRDAGQNKGSNHASPTSIPIIDLSPFTNPEGPTTARRRQTAASLVEALRHTGFAYIANHGISASTLSDAFALSKAFFALPMETKKLAPHPPGWQVHRGYSWPGLEKVSNELAPGSPTAVQSRAEPPGVRDVQAFLRQVPDLKESFDMGSPDNTHQPNVFLPLSAEATLLPPGWRPSMLSLYSAFWDLGRALLRAIAVGLRLPDEDTLVRPCAGGRYNQLRLLHYPSVEASRLETGRAARMPAHSDWSVVTLLFQDSCGGLQVEGTRAGEFVDVEPVEGAAVVNVGDLLMRWSNDHLRSTQHRVALPPQQDRFTGAERLTQERFSIPYFITTAPDALIEPLCVDAARPARHEPITQRDYGAMRARMQY